MKIKFVPIGQLIPYARNSRTHSAAQIDQIAASMIEWGWTNPILADTKGIVAGHGRVAAARKVLDSGSPLRMADGAPIPGGKVPVIDCTGWSDAQRRAYVIADNKLALNAGWDDEMLSLELEGLGDDGYDLELIGFDQAEIDALLNGDGSPGDVVQDAEINPEPPAIARPGNIWQLGTHRLMCGDSSNIGDIEQLLDGETPDLLIYDPPYDVAESWTWQYPCGKALVFSDYKHMGEAMRVASAYETIYQFVWDCCTSWYTQNRPLARHKTALFCSAGKEWNFDAAVYQDGKKRDAKTVSNTRGELEYKPLADGFVHLQTVYQEPNTQQDSSHAHAKPVKWLNALMRGAGGSLALDLFGGSGATIIAAPESMAVYAMEIDQRSCDRIIDRWQTATGLQAILMATPST